MGTPSSQLLHQQLQSPETGQGESLGNEQQQQQLSVQQPNMTAEPAKSSPQHQPSQPPLMFLSTPPSVPSFQLFDMKVVNSLQRFWSLWTEGEPGIPRWQPWISPPSDNKMLQTIASQWRKKNAVCYKLCEKYRKLATAVTKYIRNNPGVDEAVLLKRMDETRIQNKLTLYGYYYSLSKGQDIV